jgi:hypothetical protein
VSSPKKRLSIPAAVVPWLAAVNAPPADQRRDDRQQDLRLAGDDSSLSTFKSPQETE